MCRNDALQTLVAVAFTRNLQKLHLSGTSNFVNKNFCPFLSLKNVTMQPIHTAKIRSEPILQTNGALWLVYSNIPHLAFADLPLTCSSDSGLSPVLLTRARLLASEHAKLTDRLAESFDAKIAKRAGELAPVTSVLKEWDNANDVGGSFFQHPYHPLTVGVKPTVHYRIKVSLGGSPDR